MIYNKDLVDVFIYTQPSHFTSQAIRFTHTSNMSNPEIFNADDRQAVVLDLSSQMTERINVALEPLFTDVTMKAIFSDNGKSEGRLDAVINVTNRS